MEWLKRAISDEYVNYYEYDNFTHGTRIGEGGFGTVYKYEWSNCELIVALKCLSSKISRDINQEFVKEIIMLNLTILTKIDHSEQLYMILQLASSGNLRQYLRKTFLNLKWIDKLYIAKQIAHGLTFLHSHEIVHQDLVTLKEHFNSSRRSKDYRFGLAKQLNAQQETLNNFFRKISQESSAHSYLESSSVIDESSSHFIGLVEYIDPQCFIDLSYRRNKKSDVYSFGIILWEISSGIPPFQSFGSQLRKAVRVAKGYREDPIEGTPPQYIELYSQCWSADPAIRPETRAIIKTLNQLISDEKSIMNENLIESTNIIALTSDKQDNIFSAFNSEDTSVISAQLINCDGWYEAAIDKYKLKEISYNNFGRCIEVTSNYTEAKIEGFIDELKRYGQINHPRIVQFYGISHDAQGSYYLVMEYAEEGTLRNYLKNHKLTWSKKIQLAVQIAEGMTYLHNNKIIYRYLHSDNILIHNERIKIADFCVFKSHNATSITKNKIFKMIPYTDPQKLHNRNRILNEKSNVYSVGVIIWEISSECVPFENENMNTLASRIIYNDYREKPIETTPILYVNLYSGCWDRDSDRRPEMKEILNQLRHLKWYWDAINDHNINEVDYKTFDKKLTKIGRGGFGSIYSTFCSSKSKKIALKSVEICIDDAEDDIKMYTNELKLQSKIFHPRIIQFYGISCDIEKESYYLIMFTLQGNILFNGINIIHRDLHNRNILIHNGDVKITDFGLSKNLNTSTIKTNRLFGVTAYIDPQKLQNNNYILNKKSDVYSVGVLFWEISSGLIPFKDFEEDAQELLAQEIANSGLREKPLPTTPPKYVDLYSKCWHQDPEERPTVEQVLEILNNM
ncbi:kinase-like domain-containing protein [Gigaspora rosea]|uniref:Kinase-like domain-containing protein n=1 Tax=Gigaspora rosea TaxID=44941 RepID=A0A397V7F4_9GLOM|nr:kinase-like domain-containing protein [Gigaspora rosea]